jgi:PAS domain S-box-containing protein
MAEALRRADQRARAAEIEAAGRRARAAEDELRLTSAKSKRLVEANIIGIAFADVDRVIEANGAFLRLLGYTEGEAACGVLDWRTLTPPEWRETDKQARAMLFAEGTCPAYRKEFLRKDGTRVPVMVGAALVEGSNKYVCFVQDLTDVTRAEDRLREADRRKDEFLATLAHELRNPMAPIRTAVEILKRSEDPAKRAKMLEMTDRQVRHMVRLIDDLLDVSRISRGKLELQLEDVDLAQCIGHAVEACHGAIHKRGQRLEASLPESAMDVRGDPVRLTQVISNLLSNASKYSPPETTISLVAKVDGADAVVSVTDHGIGLAPQDLQSIFHLFSQVQPRSSAPDGGLGIGLHLVKQLVEMHGGRVAACSDGVGKGSTFEIRVPLDQPSASSANVVSQCVATKSPSVT